ncbi:MAG: hypothetical protein NVS9B3_08700 [Gemmatimonadaceae bacterium]
MSAEPGHIDRIIEKLVRDVETSVHAVYRGDVRQQTQRGRADVHIKAAQAAIAQLLNGSGSSAGPSANGAAGGGTGGERESLSSDEAAALTKCVMAWMPMGPPNAAAPESRCVPAGKELLPSWGERESARLAARKLSAK